MGITEQIESCNKIDDFDGLNIGDYVRYISYNPAKEEWEYKRGGYFKKQGVNIKNIPYMVIYVFNIRKTYVINKWKILEDGRKYENIFFYDPTVPNKIPPAPKQYKSSNGEIDDRDVAIINLNEKIEECNTEITYLKSKLKMYQKENKVLRMVVDKNKLI